MTYGCLTTKHHGGFCIWPTDTKVASVKDTRHKIDIVRAYADSFRKQGLQVALYYSILDLRNDIWHQNVTRDKVRLIKEQLTELLTRYGDISIIHRPRFITRTSRHSSRTPGRCSPVTARFPRSLV